MGAQKGRSMRRIFFTVSVIGLIALAATMSKPLLAGSSSQQFNVTEKIPLEGGGRWDYLTVDPEAHRLYMSRTTHVAVIDTNSNKVVGDIPNTQGVHGIALAPDLGLGFVSDGGANQVTVFDLKTLKTVTTLPAGKNPDSILYYPPEHLVFAMNGGSNSATVIDGAKKQVVATVPLGGKPEFSGYDGKDVFVNLEDKSAIDVLDPSTKKVKATWALAPCKEPSGMAVDRKDHVLFSACDNQMLAVVNDQSGKVVQTFPIGDDCDAVAFDPGTGYVYASNGGGTLTVAHKNSAGKYGVVENVPSMTGSKTMALDSSTHKVYLPSAKFTGDPTEHPRPSVVPGTVSVMIIAKK
jgi:YVTN family beta-propeller protein